MKPSRCIPQPRAVIRQVMLVGMLALVVAQALAVAPAEAAQPSPAAAALRQFAARAQAQGVMRVIVGVRARTVPEGNLPDATAVAGQRQGIARAQQAVIDRLQGKNATVVARFQFVPFLALEADAATLNALASDANITSVQEDALAKPILKESVPLIGGSATGTFGSTPTHRSGANRGGAGYGRDENPRLPDREGRVGSLLFHDIGGAEQHGGVYAGLGRGRVGRKLPQWYRRL